MNDSYLWLEDRNGTAAVQWAQTESASTKKIFENDPRFQQTQKEILDILVDSDKLAMVSLYEGYAYNLWQDDKHERGIWRRTTIQSYKSANPQWETLLDIDALAANEYQPWVFKGCIHLPKSDRCMVEISKNNQDATEMREFSLSKKEFIKNGFFVPESKSGFTWIDEDHALVTPALTPDQLTISGYPRKAYRWNRGEDLAKAMQIFEGQPTDTVAWTNAVYDHGKKYLLVGRYVNDDDMESRVLTANNQLVLLPLPKDAGASAFFNDQIFFSLRSDWKGFTAGSLLSIPVSAIGLTDVPVDQIKLVYKPSLHSAYDSVIATSDRLYVLVNENVRGQVYEAKQDAQGRWQLTKGFNTDNTFYISASDSQSDAIIFQEEGFLKPRQLVMKEGDTITELKKMKSYFDATPYVTEQFWAKSKDGVEIPYTVVRAKNLKYDGKNPTFIYGYGGFQISRLPSYSPVMGKEWLEKGGVYVSANIRGGGEFGPEWHKAAMRENKQKSYDDFIAVAEDVIARKITSPPHLGIQGGSNGGLLVGAVTMQRPDLYNAVVCEIPLLDMLRYTKLPPGASWMDEYGDPEDPKFREIILKYSPYQNISRTKKYPKILFKTTQADDRVHPGHARKMAAKMKEYGHDVLFFESQDGGHGGGGVKPEDQAKAAAYVYVYLHQQLDQ